jgi:hypothetical protein
MDLSVAVDRKADNTVSTFIASGNSHSTAAAGMNTSRAVWVGRVLFVAALGCVAAILGFLSYYFLTQSETVLAVSQFESIAGRALSASQEIVLRKRLGTISMASVIANALPDPKAYPFVFLNGYEEVSSNLIVTSSGRGMGFCPLVTPAQLEDFETFAYDFYENTRMPTFPNGTAGTYKNDVSSCRCSAF